MILGFDLSTKYAIIPCIHCTDRSAAIFGRVTSYDFLALSGLRTHLRTLRTYGGTGISTI